MDYTFDNLVAEWMKADPNHPLYDGSQMSTAEDLKTQVDYPVGQCYCLRCLQEHQCPCPPTPRPDPVAVPASGPLSSPLITTAKQMLQDSPFPGMICGTASSNERSLPLLEPPTCKGLDMVTPLDPYQPGKRLLEPDLTLRKPEEAPLNAVNTAPKKKRAKKVQNPTNGVNLQDKVREEIKNKRIFHPYMGTLFMQECVGIVPGYLMTYKCIDRDMNVCVIERFRFESFDIEHDISILDDHVM